VPVHDEDLGDAAAGRIDPAAQEVRRRALQDGIDRRRGRCADLGPPGEVQRVDLRLIQAGILGVLAVNRLDDLVRLRPCLISVSRNACMAASNSLAADGVATMAARSAMGGKRMRSTFLACETVSGPVSGILNSRQILKDR
jgi:hypothetical protein